MRFPNFLFVTLALIACNSGQGSNLKIYNGTEPTSSSPAYYSTVAFTDSLSMPVKIKCSGTLVTDTLVITAAHCFKARYVYFQRHLDSKKGDFIKVIDYQTNPDFLVSGRIGEFDIAWAKLEKPAPSSYKPIAILPLDQPLTSSETILLSGFGQTSDSAPTSSVKLEASAGVTHVGKKPFYRGFIETQSANSGSCPGDSGGSAFTKRGNEWYLAGIISGGNFRCVDGYTILADASYHSPWVEESAKVDLPGVEIRQEFGTGAAIKSFRDTLFDANLSKEQWSDLVKTAIVIGLKNADILDLSPDQFNAVLIGKIQQFFEEKSLFLDKHWQTAVQTSDISSAMNALANNPSVTEEVSLTADIFQNEEIKPWLKSVSKVKNLSIFQVRAGFKFDSIKNFSSLENLELSIPYNETVKPVLDVSLLLSLRSLMEFQSTGILIENESKFAELPNLKSMTLVGSGLSSCPIANTNGIQCSITGLNQP